MRILAASVVVLLATAAAPRAHATPPAPTGAHPRMLLDPELRAAWKEQAKLPHGPVIGAIAMCDDALHSKEHEHAQYQGAEWSRTVQGCLVAWAATDKEDYAKAAIRYMTALLDDLDLVGDGKGGDDAAKRDSGYALRNLGPATALAYDWLHDKLTPEQRAHARARWAVWLAWYADKGYRPHHPGSNYHAGYAYASTTIAVAEAGEAGVDGDALWKRVADELWGKELAAAFAPTGVLAGGDWFEGWQYGPLSVAELATGERIMRAHGVALAGVGAWIDALLRRHVYALSPSDGLFVNGDIENEKPNAEPGVLTLDAIALGTGSPEARRWARGELNRLKLADKDYFLFDALAGVGDKPEVPPRATWPTWYLASNTQTLYTRARWSPTSVWFVASCEPELDRDHRHFDGGNFVLSRGADDVVVDPTPYGALGTLTTNAPTVRSAHFPDSYQPSQAAWGGSTWTWATQTASGVVAGRCDYANAYKFQERASDVPLALRDLVLLPSDDGTAATLIVVDRATTGGADRDLYLRFRTPGKLTLAGDAAATTVGGTRLTITPSGRSSGTPTIGVPTMKDCFKDVTQGACDAARFPVTDYRVQIGGPKAFAEHAISVTDASKGDGAVKTEPISGAGWAGTRVTGTRDAVVLWPTDDEARTLSYTAPRIAKLTHVVLGAPETDDRATVTAKPVGETCAVTVVAGGMIPAKPLVVSLDASCAVTVDRAAISAPSALADASASGAHGGGGGKRMLGCCDAGEPAGGPVVLALLVVGGLVTRRGRARSAR